MPFTPEAPSWWPGRTAKLGSPGTQGRGAPHLPPFFLQGAARPTVHPPPFPTLRRVGSRLLRQGSSGTRMTSVVWGALQPKSGARNGTPGPRRQRKVSRLHFLTSLVQVHDQASVEMVKYQRTVCWEAEH